MDPHGPTIAPRCPTATIADKIKSIHFQKESKNLFLPTISILPLCSQSAQLFQTLAMRAEAWQAILGVLTLVMTKVRRGYTLQFARRPPRFRGVLATTVRSENAQVLHAELMNLLEKGAIEIVPPAQSESGFCSHYFLVPKKDGGLRPILDLRFLSYALMKRLFRMITLKQTLPQICPGDWFMSLDLKDAYFHIQVAPVTDNSWDSHSKGGISIQGPAVWIIPGSPHFYTMHGCGSLPSATDGNPHTQLPRRLAHSGPVAGGFSIAKTLLLSHLDCLGLRVNFDKSILSPSQWVSFLGTVIDSVQMTATSRKVPPRQVREQRHKLILIAPIWRNQPWVSELFQLLKSAPWPIPLRTSSLKRTAQYGIHGPSYESCMCGRSTGAFRTPRVCPKHYGRS